MPSAMIRRAFIFSLNFRQPQLLSKQLRNEVMDKTTTAEDRQTAYADTTANKREQNKQTLESYQD